MAGRDKEPPLKTETASDDEGFLSRWSRRKAEAKTTDETAGADQAEVVTSENAGEAPADADQQDAGAIDPGTLPDIDSLGSGSDFSVFMQAGVPSSLKTKALRRLWQVKPDLANLDGLIDYGEDLTGSFKAVDHLKTAYEVGRGFLRDDDDAVAQRGEGDSEDRSESGTANAEPLENGQTQAEAEIAEDDPAISSNDDPKHKA
ncbi:MAG: DUF3306 domain-containing protein [Pseudomonadota bacterium]